MRYPCQDEYQITWRYVYRIPETLSQEILAKMHAPPKPDYPIIAPNDLTNYDAFIFGIPTRYGNFPAQWKAFWDATGQLWATGALHGKYASVFVSTGTPGGGQETTVLHSVGTLAHHGIIFVPLGYRHTMPLHSNLSEVHGGGPWGAGSFAVRHVFTFYTKSAWSSDIDSSQQGADGSRQPSELELELAKIHGEQFYKTVARVNFE